MAVTPAFRQFVLEQLQRVLPAVRARNMFGGVGIYSDDFFFALLDNDTAYFKVNDSNRGDFEVRGMQPFRPFGDEGESMQYYEVPSDLLEDPDALRPWADKSLLVARQARRRKGKS